MTTAVAAEEMREGLATLVPAVTVGPSRQPLPAEALDNLIRIVVDSHLQLPDMFELTFLDQGVDVLTQAGLRLGTEIEVRAGAPDEQQDWSIVAGEITAIEGNYGGMTLTTTVRGYSQDHRLQRARRSRSFLDAKDSDVARDLAREAGLTVGQIDATTQLHPMLTQADQTDWSFLTERAMEIGYEVGVVEGQFHFRRGHTVQDGTPVPVALGEALVRFQPRISAANLVPEVETRTQDLTEAKAIAVKVATATSAVDIGAGTAAAAAGDFMPTATPSGPATTEVGPPASIKGNVVVDRGFSVAAGSDQALRAAADALAAHTGSSFAEAEGEIIGDGRVVAGAVLDVTGVPTEFTGKWMVTSARHIFDNNDAGYRTRFSVSGRHNRSLLALTSAGNGRSSSKRIEGVVCGVVTDVNDPLHLGRVKVTLPWLSPEYESTWAPVSQLFAGASGGALFLPQPKDQVLVAFEHGDLRRPYVLGSVLNNRTGAGWHLNGSTGSTKPGQSAVGTGQPAPVIKRGWISPTGNRLVFHDEAPPSGGNPTAAQVIMATAQDKIAVIMDAVAGTLTIQCTPGNPPGTLKIECDGNVEVVAGANGTLTVDGGQQLSLKGKTVQIEAQTALTIKGQPIKLN